MCTVTSLMPYIFFVLYNAHKLCRCRVERAIGQLKRRWGLLHQELRLSPEKAGKITVACAILHNLAKRFNLPAVNG